MPPAAASTTLGPAALATHLPFGFLCPPTAGSEPETSTRLPRRGSLPLSAFAARSNPSRRLPLGLLNPKSSAPRKRTERASRTPSPPAKRAAQKPL